jgi:hypothetical protein
MRDASLSLFWWLGLESGYAENCSASCLCFVACSRQTVMPSVFLDFVLSVISRRGQEAISFPEQKETRRNE